MHIIVYRTKMEDAVRAFEELRDKLLVVTEGNLFISHRYVIDIKPNLRIDFRTGDLFKMAGLCPFAYNTDDSEASNFLSYNASKINGKELNTLDEVFKLAFAYYNTHHPVNTGNWR